MGQKEKTLLNQYQELKESYKDAVFLFQVGGFYQAYYHDAKLLSEVLHLELVGRKAGGGKQIPMCGIPKKFVDKHVTTLNNQGYRVVLCAQKEESMTEGGLRLREVSGVYESTIPQIDLTEQWEAYLESFDNFDFEKAVPEKKSGKTKNQTGTISNTGSHDILEELKALDLCRMTPFAAMELLYEWREKFITSEI